MNDKLKIAVIGLGYVGLPISVSFAEKDFEVIGFDLNSVKISQYQNGIDMTNEIGSERLSKVKNIFFTTDESYLKKANFYIVAVPTPIFKDNKPNLSYLYEATNLVGRNLNIGDYVVFESTVYPGLTEEECVPILEKVSGMKLYKDFKVGYSPERINPGDKVHRLEKIKKVVSGCDKESLDYIAKVYSKIIEAGIYEAPSIKIAEASKVIENSQRDINIAFMNELSIMFDQMGIDTNEVLKAASTKWNFLKFTPGLVGGHCIGVDPYYLTYKAEMHGYHPQIILSGRKLNDEMGKYVAEKTVKMMIRNNIPIKDSKVLIMGMTFKEDCPDLRNSKVIDIVHELKEYGINVKVSDSIANKNEAFAEYQIELIDIQDVPTVDAIVVAVAHKQYKSLSKNDFIKLYKNSTRKILIDVKSIYKKEEFSDEFDIWSL